MTACVLKEESFLFFFFKYKNDFPFKVKGSENSDLAWKASEKVSFQGYFHLDQDHCRRQEKCNTHKTQHGKANAQQKQHQKQKGNVHIDAAVPQHRAVIWS